MLVARSFEAILQCVLKSLLGFQPDHPLVGLISITIFSVAQLVSEVDSIVQSLYYMDFEGSHKKLHDLIYTAWVLDNFVTYVMDLGWGASSVRLQQIANRQWIALQRQDFVTYLALKTTAAYIEFWQTEAKVHKLTLPSDSDYLCSRTLKRDCSSEMTETASFSYGIRTFLYSVPLLHDYLLKNGICDVFMLLCVPMVEYEELLKPNQVEILLHLREWARQLAKT